MAISKTQHFQFKFNNFSFQFHKHSSPGVHQNKKKILSPLQGILISFTLTDGSFCGLYNIATSDVGRQVGCRLPYRVKYKSTKPDRILESWANEPLQDIMIISKRCVVHKLFGHNLSSDILLKSEPQFMHQILLVQSMSAGRVRGPLERRILAHHSNQCVPDSRIRVVRHYIQQKF